MQEQYSIERLEKRRDNVYETTEFTGLYRRLIENYLAGKRDEGYAALVRDG